MLSNKNHYKHALIFGSITGGVIFFVLILGFILGSANNQSMQAAHRWGKGAFDEWASRTVNDWNKPVLVRLYLSEAW